jgi:hypothetical protein
VSISSVCRHFSISSFIIQPSSGLFLFFRFWKRFELYFIYVQESEENSEILRSISQIPEAEVDEIIDLVNGKDHTYAAIEELHQISKKNLKT